MGRPELKNALLRCREMNNLLALFVARKRLSKECIEWLRAQRRVCLTEQTRKDVDTVLNYGRENI